jgi:diacylglycerol kinase (ATP)
MRACIILNPGAGTSEQGERLRALQSHADFDIFDTRDVGQATRLAHDAPAKGYDTVVAAGGDGTVNEVINGLVHARVEEVRLAILPLGTGNDLARTLAIPFELEAAMETLLQGRETTIDLMKVTTSDAIKYAANVAAGGFTGQMNEAMTPEIKATWGPLAYLRGALEVLPDLTAYETFLRIDDGEQAMTDAYNIIIANARTAGGGTIVAPAANPEDGLLDVVIVHRGTAAELAGVAARLVAGDYTSSPIVSHTAAKRVVIFSKPGMWFNVDGELLTNGPIQFDVLPREMRIIVGDDYRASP